MTPHCPTCDQPLTYLYITGEKQGMYLSMGYVGRWETDGWYATNLQWLIYLGVFNDDRYYYQLNIRCPHCDNIHYNTPMTFRPLSDRVWVVSLQDTTLMEWII